MSEELEVKATVIGETPTGTDYIMKVAGQEYEISRQIFDDVFNYDMYNCVAPPYSLDSLLYFFDNNTWHARCCRLKSACTVGLGYVLQLIEGKEESEAEKTKLEEFFSNCNPTETFTEILGKFMLDYEVLGNAYLEIVRNVSGQIVGIYHMPAATMRVRKDRDGYVQMRDTRYVYFKNFGDKTIMDKMGHKASPENPVLVNERASEVLHFFEYSPRSDFYGVPEWLPSMGSMLGNEKAADYNLQFFENNAVPQFAVIVRKATLGQPVKNVIADYFRKEIKAKHHKTLVLEVPGEGELDLKELATETKDSSFRFYRLDNRDEVIAAHGVPPRMVGIISPGSMGGKGDPEGQKEAFLTQIIQPRQTRLNHRINKLILGKGVGALNYVFVLESLNPQDDAADSERFDRYIKIGVMTINEVRDQLRKPRYKNMPDADQPFIFTSSGPILVSQLSKYMDVALMPKQPAPPGLPGSPGVSTSDNNPKRGKVGKDLLPELEKILKLVQEEINQLRGQEDGTNQEEPAV